MNKNPAKLFVCFNLCFHCSFIVKDWGTCSVPCGEGIRQRKIECQIFLEFSKTVATLPDEKCPGPKPSTTEICYAGLCDSRTPRRPMPRSMDGADKIQDGQKKMVTRAKFIPHLIHAYFLQLQRVLK